MLLVCGLDDTLALALSQQSGEVRYNGAELDQFNVRRTAAYVDQVGDLCFNASCL